MFSKMNLASDGFNVCTSIIYPHKLVNKPNTDIYLRKNPLLFMEQRERYLKGIFKTEWNVPDIFFFIQ